MPRGSVHLSMFVEGDHSYDERDVGNIPVLIADDHRVESHVIEVDRQRDTVICKVPEGSRVGRERCRVDGRVGGLQPRC